MRRFWNRSDDAVLRLVYPTSPTWRVALALERSVYAIYGRAELLGLQKSAAYRAGPHACRLRRGDNVGAPFRFKRGQVPHNKGLRRPGWGPGRMKETQFKKGERRGVAVTLWKPIGAERLSKEGYLQRKVNDDLPLQARWRAVHVIVWEDANGPVPAGHAVVFRNGDKADIRLGNLECITRAALMLRNSVHNYPKPVAAVVQLLGALNRQIHRRTHHVESAQY